MATVVEAVKESLVGTEVEPQMSTQTKADFMQHAKQDEDGQHYMNEDGFIDAVCQPRKPERTRDFTDHWREGCTRW